MSCKLFLVPEDVIHTWRSNQRTEQIDKPVETSLSHMDKSMQNILKDNKLSVYDKEKLYTQKLATYVDMRDQMKRHLPEIHLDSVPKNFHTKANALLKYLQSDKDVEWDAQGQLVLNGKVIPTSNIVDLIHDGMRLRKKMKRPPGWKELSHHIIEKNVPRELIGNEEWISEPTLQPYSHVDPEQETVKKQHVGKIKGQQKTEPWTTPYSVKRKRRQRASKIKGLEQVRKWISLQDV